MLRPLRSGLIVAAALLSLAVSAQAGSPPPTDIVPLVARLLPSVVNISTVRVETPTHDANEAAMTEVTGKRRKSLGSGFIIDPSGIIVTNKHVIEGATDIHVTLHDDTVLSAEIMSDAGRGDLALLRVTPDAPLPAVKFGNSDMLRQGQPVIAIGNPLGFGSSVTTGIVSALDRDVKTSPYDNYIQTDASINQGNSGGPLFDLDGEVIGVNTALITANDAGGSIGIGLSIPSNDVVFVVKRLLKYGRVRPGWLGIDVQKMTPQMAEVLGLKRVNGVIVTGLEPSQAKLQNLVAIGDVIEQVQDLPVRDVRMFTRAAAIQEIGSVASLVVWRNGVRSVVKVMVEEDPEDLKNKSGIPADGMDDGYVDAPNLGLSVAAIDDAARTTYKLAAGAAGVVVTSVVPGSHAADQGLLPGDTILRVQFSPVDTVDGLWKAVSTWRAGRHTHMLMLLRSPDGTDRFVVMPTA